MVNIGYYNGEIGLIEELRIPLTDRVSFFGDGVYDATYARNHVPFLLDDHIDRFYRSAERIEMPFDMPKAALKTLILDLCARVEDPDNMVYFQLTRGTAMRKHAFPAQAKPNLWVLVYPKPMADMTRKYRLLTVEDTRYFHCDIKTLNLLPNVMAAQRAQEAGCDEVVFHREGRVTEGAHSNIHIIKDGAFITAPLDCLVLPGITRRHLIRHCLALGMKVEERPYTLGELMDGDEVLFTSAGSLCCAASHVDGKPVGGRAPALLEALQGAYIRQLEEETGVAVRS